MRTPIRFALMAAFFLMLAAPLLAQRRDTPLSPSEHSYRMLEDAKMQTADSANGVVAVVWGTTELLNGDSLYAVFYVQLIKGAVPTGEPMRLGPADARLMSHIRVVPLGNDFLILYSEYGNVSTWSQFLETKTGILKKPYICSYSWLVADPARPNIVTLGGGGHPWRIFYYSDELVSCVFDSLGVPVGYAQPVGTLKSEMRSYFRLPGIMLLTDTTEGPSRIYHRLDGRLDTRPTVLLNGPFHLGGDTSLLILRDSTLCFHSSIFGLVDQERTLPLSEWQVSPGQALLWRYDDRRIALYFPTGIDGDNSMGRLSSYRVLRLRMDSIDGSILADTIAGDSLMAPYSRTLDLSGYERLVGNSNTSQIIISFGDSWYYHARGYVTLDSSGTLAPAHTPLPLPSGASTRIIPVRREDNRLSIVEIHLRDTTVLSLPVIPVPHRLPTIVPFPGSIVCTWRQSDTIARDIHARWDLSGDTVYSSSVFTLEPAIGLTGRIGSSQKFQWDLATPLPGGAGLTYNFTERGNVEIVIGSRPPITRRDRVATSRFVLGLPTEQGWKNVESIICRNMSDGYSLSVAMITGYIVGHDPDVGDVIVRLLYQAYDSPIYVPAIRGYRSGGLQWEVKSPWNMSPHSTLVPMGNGHYILIGSPNSYYVRDNKPADSFELSLAGRLSPRYHKLFGSRFARTSWDADDTTRFHVEIFDTTGSRLHAAALKLAAKTDDYMLLPSRADSSLVILFGGDRGVRGAVLKKDLAPVVVDTLLSATAGRVSNPAGAFRGDTLFLVWEDYRGEVSRIYGTYHSGSWLPSSVEEGRDDRSVAGDAAPFIHPNPAGDAMTITAYTGNDRGLLFDMSDLLGREVLRGRIAEGEIGEAAARVDLSGIPAGTYIVRVWKDGRSRSQVVIKR